ncbi:M3 family metallopeptidase [soil metagenome]
MVTDGSVKTLRRTAALSCLLLAACAHPNEPVVHAKTPVPSVLPAAASNPLLQPSTLAYHLPPFDKIKDADFRPAFDAGMVEQRKEVDAIAHDPATPTFENTIVAIERSGRTLARAAKAFFNLNVSIGGPAMEAIESEMAPRLAAHQDAIALDAALFARIDAVYGRRATLGLDRESAQLLDRYEKQFVRAGARLSDADKATLKQVNQELSTLTTQFRQSVLKSTKDGALVIGDAAELEGLSGEQIGAASEAAKARGLAGKWVLTLRNTTLQPALAQLTHRDVRERLFQASVTRSIGGDADTTKLVSQIVLLRAKQAALLGYPSYASYALAEETAGTPEAVFAIFGKLVPAAVLKAKSEGADIQALIDAQAKKAHTQPFRLAPWDGAFYAEQVRKARYDFDDAQVKPYFELNQVLQEGVFFAAHELYGITFKERKDLPVYQADVRVFEVFDADGSSMALLLLDYFGRDTKQGGAWMDTYVDQSTLFGEKPVVVNNLNVPKPASGEPALLTFDEVTTMFHEFGHGLHGLFANTKYPMLSGTAVPPDFVEFPSQFNEMWAREPVVLAHYAKHYKTGEPMPKALVDKILAAQTSGQGFATTEYLAAAMLDLSWHQLGAAQVPAPDKVMAFEAAALKKDGVDWPPVPPRYHSPYFLHVFASSGYAAGYYAYIWSEILARDSGAWFHAHGGLTRANGDVLRAKILSRVRTEEPSVLFQSFYGGPPTIEPLIAYRGLGPASKAAPPIGK